MRIYNRTRKALLTAIAVSVLALGAAPFTFGSASAQDAVAFVKYSEEVRLDFLGSDNSQVVLKSSNICGGSGCAMLKAINECMGPAKAAVQTQGAGRDMDEMIETFNLPEDLKAKIRDAVAKDIAGRGDGPNQITVPITDESDFVALLKLIDFAIATGKGA